MIRLFFTGTTGLMLTFNAHAVYPVSDAGAYSWFAQFMTQYGNIVSAIDGNSAKISQALGEVDRVAALRQVSLYQQQARSELENNLSLPIDPCANAGRGLGNPDFDRIRPGVDANSILSNRGRAAGGKVETGSAKLNQAIRIAEGREKSPTPETQAILAAAGACEAYASDVRRDACIAAGLRTTNPRYANADVLSSSLFSGAQIDTKEGRMSYTFAAEQVAAAKAYVRNLYNTLDIPTLTSAQARTDEGKKLLGVRDAYLAKVDLAQRASLEWQVTVQPNPATIPMIKAMIQSNGAAAEFIRQDLNRTWPNWQSTGISNRHFEYLEVARRYANAQWVVEIAKQSNQASLMREQLMLSAQTNYLLDKLVNEVRYNNIVQGNNFMSSTNKELQPELLNLYKQATSAR